MQTANVTGTNDANTKSHSSEYEAKAVPLPSASQKELTAVEERNKVDMSAEIQYISNSTGLIRNMSLSLNSPQQVQAQAAQLSRAPLEEVLRWAHDSFGIKAAIGTSFQGAGLVMIHHAVEAGIQLPVFTLDTGVLFPETLELKERLETFFGITIETVQPALSLETQAAEFGAELWATKPDLCCQLRKVEPLKERLASLALWITGVRQEQSETRKNASILERYLFDPLMELTILKLNPMVAWTREAVWEYIHKHGIPYNPLHDRGYRSIGCQPCTRVSGAQDGERAGRWAGSEKTECGIHTFLEAAK